MDYLKILISADVHYGARERFKEWLIQVELYNLHIYFIFLLEGVVKAKVERKVIGVNIEKVEETGGLEGQTKEG